MLSNLVKRIPIASIQVSREDRQRREIDVSDILESVKRRGVLCPICVTKSGRLIFGERRLTAARAAGHTEILARIAPDDLAPLDLQLLELEENIMRQDLPWQDKARAMLRMYNLRKDEVKDLSYQNFADSIGYNVQYVYKLIGAAEEMEKGNTRVAEAPSYQKAVNVITRQRERDENNVLASIIDTLGGGEAPPVEQEAEPLLCESFHTWAPLYTGPKFNLVHCDFPFGVGLDTSDQLQAGGTAHATYEDTPDIYWSLLDTLATHQERFISHSAHMIFWFAMEYYTETKTFFSQRMPDWTFDNYPLVWHKTDNKGIAPDVERRPRRIYETAFFGWRGSRKLVKLGSNAYGAPKENSAHPSTKPEPVLRHFLSMVVDPYSRVLDPTCGSGSAIRAAESLGAAGVLGLELDPTFHADAVARLRRFRSINKLAGVIA